MISSNTSVTISSKPDIMNSRSSLFWGAANPTMINNCSS